MRTDDLLQPRALTAVDAVDGALGEAAERRSNEVLRQVQDKDTRRQKSKDRAGRWSSSRGSCREE